MKHPKNIRGKLLHGEAVGLLLAGLLPGLLILMVFLAVPGASFNKWDNFELFTPYLWFAHSRVLQGEFPHWCQSQFLGEPVHAVGQYGVLYPGYTFCVWLAQWSGMGPARLMDVVVVLHAVISGWALYGWARLLSVSRIFSIIAAISTVCSGWFLYKSSVLMFVMPYLAATALGLCGVTWLVQGRRKVRGFGVSVAAISMAAHVGHGQFAFYVGIVLGTYAVGYALVTRRLKRTAVPIACAFVVAALISMPTVLPVLDFLRSTGRYQAVAEGDFLAKSIPPGGLLGLVLPVYLGEDGFSKEVSLYTVYGGAWIIPAILLGALTMRECDQPNPSSRRLWVMMVALALLWLSLAIGQYNPFYRLSYHVPVWSRFRWPYKWMSFALPFLGLAAALALQRLSLLSYSWRRAALLGLYAVGALLLWRTTHSQTTGASLVAGVAGLASVFTLPWISRTSARIGLLLAVLLGSGAVLLMVVDEHRYKSYSHEPYGKYSAQALQIDNAYRVLPVSPSNPPGARMQPLGLYESALANGYLSATGTRWALTLSNVLGNLPTNGDGSVRRYNLGTLLNSHLLRSHNVGYLLADKNDSSVREYLDGHEDFRLVTATDVSLVYADRRAMPRAYFATDVLRHTANALISGLIRNGATPRTALVVGGESIGHVPVGRVDRLGWFDQHVEVNVTAPQGGFMVISMAHTPRWRAQVDGHPVALFLTNGALCGVAITPGATRVVLHYDATPLRNGLWLALLGVVLGAGYVYVAFVRR